MSLIPNSVQWWARMDEIAAAIAAGADPALYDEELDGLLGTKMDPRDSIVEATWEDVYRNGGDE